MNSLLSYLQRQGALIRQWAKDSGRDALASTRESVRSVQVEIGVVLFAVLWLLGASRFGVFVSGDDTDRQLFALVRRAYGGWVWGIQAVLLLLHMAVGAAWGMILRNAEQGLGDLRPSWRLDRWRGGPRMAATTGLLFVLHTAVLLRDMGRHPALFHDASTGHPVAGLGLSLLSLHGPPAWMVVPLLGFLLLVLLLAAMNAVRRIGRWFRKFSRPTQIAMGVVTVFCGLSSLGFRTVWRLQAETNRGPNLLVLVVDGLRGDHVFKTPTSAPQLQRLMTRGRYFRRCVPATTIPEESLKSFLTGQSPLQHGLRFPFPAAGEVALGAGSLPAVFRAAGYHTGVVADAGGAVFSRWREDFDEVQAPDGRAVSVLFREALEGSFHVLPYLSGRWGRKILSPLRGSRTLSDPALLAEETVAQLKKYQFQRKFFLMVHWSSLGSVTPSPDLSVPYETSLAAVDRAVGRVLDVLRDGGFEENTWVVLWSPRGMALTPEESIATPSFAGPVFFDAPFALLEPHLRSGARRMRWDVQTQDLAPTLLTAFHLPVPETMEGHDALSPAVFNPGAPILYFESTGVEESLFSLPPLGKMLLEDREAPGHWTLAPAYVDPVFVRKRRAVQVDRERLEYQPSPEGVRFLYFRWDKTWSPDLSGIRAWGPRLKELKGIFYQHLSREPGWRPQNDYWVPEAFLREVPPEEE